MGSAMAPPMFRLPSRFRRLDEILADLPLDDPMLLTELDGYLTAIAVCPDGITPSEWLPPIWSGNFGEDAPFDDPLDVQLFTSMVTARHGEILRDLGRSKHQPIFDTDPRSGEALWEEWIDGWAMAMRLRPDAWSAVADGDDADAAAALADLLTLVDVAGDNMALTSVEINRICDEASAKIPADVLSLHTWCERHRAPATLRAAAATKPGRNAPCACGSGKKSKRCCGAD